MSTERENRPGANRAAETQDQDSAPYDAASQAYEDAGWAPIPVRGKSTPVTGATGYNGTVTPEKIAGWRQRRPEGHDNIALRHQSTVAIDVDHGYGEKNGPAQLNEWARSLGLSPLPPTFSSTARGDDSPSRQYLFSVMLDVPMNTKPCRSVEICNRHHRYTVAWPSTHPDTGGTYHWYAPGEPDGDSVLPSWGPRYDGVPPEADIAELPLDWFEALLRPANAGMDTDAPVLGLDEVIPADGSQPDELISHLIAKWSVEHIGHDEFKQAGIHAVMLAREGRPGVRRLFDILLTRYSDYVSAERPEEAEREVSSLLSTVLTLGQQKRLETPADDFDDDAPATSKSTADPAQAKGKSTDKYQLNLGKDKGPQLYAAKLIAEDGLDNRYRFAPGLGWLKWDGRRWETSAEDQAFNAVAAYTEKMEKEHRETWKARLEQADALTERALARATPEQLTDDKGKAVSQEDLFGQLADENETLARATLQQQAKTAANQSVIWRNHQSNGAIVAIAKLAARMDGIRTDDDAFDQHPDLLNVANGVVDLRTGKLTPHDPRLLFTRVTRGAYVPGRVHPRWQQALEAVDPKARDWFQRRIGQAFTGYAPPDDTVLLLDGGGSNGKTTVLAGVKLAAGDFAVDVPHKALTDDGRGHPTEMMVFRGARLAVMEETPEEGVLNTQQLKTVVGQPTITARHIAKDFVTYKVTHSLLITTNHTPRVSSTDHGTWRRLLRLKWPIKYVDPGEELGENRLRADQTLRPDIEQGRDDVYDGVITWAVEGAVKVLAPGGYDEPPEVVKEAVREWRNGVDIAYQFASEHLVLDEDSVITVGAMAEEFNEFLRIGEHNRWSSQLINQRLPDALYRAHGERVEPASRRVRKTDKESFRGFSGGGLEAGRQARLWRGVRFLREGEAADQRHLTAVK